MRVAKGEVRAWAGEGSQRALGVAFLSDGWLARTKTGSPVGTIGRLTAFGSGSTIIIVKGGAFFERPQFSLTISP